MFAYFAIGVAIGVVCIVTIIQRFTKNLLGREGYLMHTLPVHPEQLVASKLISSMVWVICSGVVGILSVLLMLVGLGAFEDPKTVINGETITTGWGDVLKFSWKAIQSIGGEELAWIIVLGLAGVAVLILCIYAACMIGQICPPKNSLLASHGSDSSARAGAAAVVLRPLPSQAAYRVISSPG